MKKHRRFLWFLFGLGSSLQLIASLSITELFVYVSAVILWSGEFPRLRRNGLLPLLYLSLLVCANAALSCFVNRTPFAFALRGMATVTLIPCTIVVAHWMLRKDMSNFKWMLVGVALSEFICTFIFQKSVEITVSGTGKAADIMAGSIYWISRISKIVQMVPDGWYLQCPLLISALLPLGLAAFSLLTSASGRSSALGSMGTALLVLLGGKTPSQIQRRVCKNFFFLCVVGVMCVLAFKSFYSLSASKGWLGEEAQKKYELQTKGGTSIMALLMGGRMESFCGLIACVDRPLVGFGPWAFDKYGYIDEFIYKYGTVEDAEAHERSKRALQQFGIVRLIPGHSFITMFWLWFGIFGLVFWLYVIFVLIRYLRQDCYAVPQWYMWLAASTPTLFWNIFFSPFGNRVPIVTMIVAVLMVRAVRKGIQPLPPTMIQAIAKIERR